MSPLLHRERGMAVSRTIRTKNGISEFIIPSENGDEYVTAFKYLDHKVEVHSLKKECAPLYLEEHTTVNTLALEACGMVLVALTPRTSSAAVEMRVWDVTSPLGFTPKEVCYVSPAGYIDIFLAVRKCLIKCLMLETIGRCQDVACEGE